MLARRFGNRSPPTTQISIAQAAVGEIAATAVSSVV
jgi:hypothetical protein